MSKQAKLATAEFYETFAHESITGKFTTANCTYLCQSLWKWAFGIMLFLLGAMVPEITSENGSVHTSKHTTAHQYGTGQFWKAHFEKTVEAHLLKTAPR